MGEDDPKRVPHTLSSHNRLDVVTLNVHIWGKAKERMVQSSARKSLSTAVGTPRSPAHPSLGSSSAGPSPHS